MKPLLCKDGSTTFYNEEVEEAYHTPLGAAMEAREKYVAPCNIEQRCKQDIVILDVCYGLGYNSAAAIEAIKKENNNCNITIIGLEIDKDIIDKSLDIPFPFAHKELFEELLQHYDAKTRSFTLTKDNVSFTILIGDAKERIKEVITKADIIFFDPFSPTKAPALWETSFMKEVYATSAEDALLVTYSCARKVRDNLRSAGFEVSDGPVVGRRGPATLGRVTKSS